MVLTANKKKSKRKSKSRAGTFSVLINDKTSKPLQVDPEFAEFACWSQTKKETIILFCFQVIRAKRGMKMEPSKRGSSGRSGAFSVLVSHCFFVLFFSEKRCNTATQVSCHCVFTREIHRVTDRQTDPTQAHWQWAVPNKTSFVSNSRNIHISQTRKPTWVWKPNHFKLPSWILYAIYNSC